MNVKDEKALEIFILFILNFTFEEIYNKKKYYQRGRNKSLPRLNKAILFYVKERRHLQIHYYFLNFTLYTIQGYSICIMHTFITCKI